MFLFSPCQVGAETVFKNEVKILFPDFRPAFSRPGLITFKVSDEPDEAVELAAGLSSRSVFARTASVSLGKIESKEPELIAAEAWKITDKHHYFINRVHVFQRDTQTPGNNGFEPGPAQAAAELHHSLIAAATKTKFLGVNAADVNAPALRNETVLDIVETAPGNYLAGVHRVVSDDSSSFHSRYPGGVVPLTLPENAVSRAWLKFEEALRWSGLPVKKDDICLDIGSAPGGASQVLLARGATVLGIDPAEMSPVVLKHPHFTHLRGKVSQIKRPLTQNVRWLFSDMNVAPNYTFDVLEEIVARKDVSLQGLLFTLKLFQWKLAGDLPKYAERLRQWGFAHVQMKQLVFNRQEVMVKAHRIEPGSGTAGNSQQ